MFRINAQDAGCLKYLFHPRSFDLAADGGAWVLSHKAQPHIQVAFEWQGEKL